LIPQAAIIGARRFANMYSAHMDLSAFGRSCIFLVAPTER